MYFNKKIYNLNNIDYEIYIFVDTDKNIWYKAKEIALILEYKDTKYAIRDNVDDDDRREWKDLKGGGWQPPP